VTRFTSARALRAQDENHNDKNFVRTLDAGRALMGLARSICAMCVTALLPLSTAAQVKDPEAEMASAMAHRFITLAGTRENAMALAYSLRNGERVMLVRDGGGRRLPTTTVFELPTRRMQWDDVGLCLALVEDSLAREGVYQPDAEQLEAALLRVLQMIGDGLDWKPDSGVRVRGKGG
jgi:hypothetical protein